ncbi:efflux RND transporter permease subunit [Occallatibacter savannae]|uniref:efflux RND transporter permease subunit n=1 Tax=Occallatibacter savannae TaxID=1002691 RepID=UPI000D699C76|nr:CusA/CzcA family heavy metal efflux RND transporter [Occallatibacter savannae]
MIDRIVSFSIRHKFVILCLVAAASIAGWWSLTHASLDVLPELGDRQVIILSRWDRSPDMVEAQVTYPIVTAMLGAPHVKSVRGVSDFGYSYVYVIFDDDVDLYWARTRTLEYLSGVLSRLPEGAKSEIGPDATSLGWIYQYALVDTTGQHSLSELRSYQDWFLKYHLRSVPGVADVASVGGYSRQYQVNVDPNRLRGFGISISQVVDAVRGGNVESSARMLDFGGTEYMIRGRGYAKSIEDFRNIVIATPTDGSPIRVSDVGEVVEGPDLRRGVADLNGAGEVVLGVVIMRSGENAMNVIGRVENRIRQIEPSLPKGVTIKPVYDRSQLIRRTINSTEITIAEVALTLALIIIVFLWHFPSASIPLITMPVAVLAAFIPLRLMGMSINIMSLAGVAIAFGELVDAAIVVAEQTQKKLEQWERSGRPGKHSGVILMALREVARPTFFALLVIAISFLPVLTLQGEEGRLFRPLVLTKTIAVAIAALLALTLDPALRLLLTRVNRFEFRPAWLCKAANAVLVGRIRAERDNVLSRTLMQMYEPVLMWTLRNKKWVFGIALVLMALTVPAFLSLGSEFMPPMDEGTILYMPTTMPGISIAQSQRLLQATDLVLKQFPEVEQVLGKAGRAETATDPAPLSMLETLVVLKPHSQWRHIPTWYSSWSPEWAKVVFRHVTPDTISTEELVSQMEEAVRAPGLSNAWTMPIRGRTDMLTSGIRTPVGLKISGDDAAQVEAAGQKVAAILKSVPGTRGVFAEAVNQGYFLDVSWRRDELARYGISMKTAEDVLSSAVGGDDIGTVYEGTARYPVNVRYMRDFRGTDNSIGAVLVPAGGERQVPISELADIRRVSGPAMIRDENGATTAYVYVDLGGRDPGSYMVEANKALSESLHLPAGYTATWGGQSEAIARSNERLKLVVPITVAIVILLIYVNTRSAVKTFIVLLAVPFSAIGAVWSLYLLHYNLSVAVWVGFIALLAIDAETGVFMLLYLDLAYTEAVMRGSLESWLDLRRTVLYGAAKRLRPKFMTFAVTCIGLFPIMWSDGTGSAVMKRIAAPMVGGIITSFLLELLVYPAIYEIWRRRSVAKMERDLAARGEREQQDDKVGMLIAS